MNVMQLLLKRYRRKVNKVIKGGSVLSILFAIISLLIPPFNIYADTISMSNIVGINYTVSNSMVVGTVTYNNMTYNRYSTDYDVEIKLDNSYLGWCQLTIEYDYYDRDSSGVVSKNTNVTRRIYINGDTVHININILNNYGSQPLIVLVSNPRVTTITNSNVVPYGDLATLEDILSVLNDIYINTSVDLYDELQNIVSNTSISNQYLEAILKLKQWHPYIESYPFIITLFKRNYNTVDMDFNNTSYTNYLDYPLFIIPSGSIIENRQMYNSSDRNDYYIVFGTNESINSINDFQTYFNFSSGSGEFTLSYQSIWVSSEFRIIKITIHCVQSGIFTITAKDSQRYFMPIVSIRKDQATFSTEFALRFKFSNSLLDSLNIIANGTTQSNQSSSDLQIQKGSFDTTSNDLYTSENAFNTDMNNKLQSIDTSFNPSTSFGSKFLSSADWVRTQFNNLTSTSPFGTVLSFSMLLGLSLLIIGKVFK